MSTFCRLFKNTQETLSVILLVQYFWISILICMLMIQMSMVSDFLRTKLCGKCFNLPSTESPPFNTVLQCCPVPPSGSVSNIRRVLLLQRSQVAELQNTNCDIPLWMAPQWAVFYQAEVLHPVPYSVHQQTDSGPGRWCI